MIKPDGVQRGLIGKIISRFEERGFTLKALKLALPGDTMFEKHYAEHKERPFFKSLIRDITCGPVTCMIWEGKNAVSTARKMIGETDPLDSAPGTIRGDLGLDKPRNLVHGSDSVKSAKREIDLWFKNEEKTDWVSHSYN